MIINNHHDFVEYYIVTVSYSVLVYVHVMYIYILLISKTTWFPLYKHLLAYISMDEELCVE